ncbi:serine/threonine protein kinase [Dietzia sp. NPDC055343]
MSSSPGNFGWNDPGASGPGPLSPPQSRNGVTWALGALVVVLVVALAGVVGYLLAAPDDEPPAAVPAEFSSQQSAPERVTVTAAPAPSASPPEVATTVTPVGDRGNTTAGDLGLPIPMTRPACDGRGIVVLYSAVTPGDYAQEIASALEQYPGASYLRTDMACPSLRQRDENGNVIYAVYRPSGYSKQELCSDVRSAGSTAYGRWLDTTSDPSVLVTC